MKKQTWGLEGFAGHVVVSLMMAVGLPAWAAFDLGGAAGYAVFQLGGGQNWNTSDAFIEGNVALGPNIPNVSVGKLAVNGNVYDYGNWAGLSAVRSWTDKPLGQNPTRLTTYSGTVYHNALTLGQAAQDARDASTAAKNYVADKNLGDVTGNKTVTMGTPNTSHSDVYVIDIGKLALGNGEVLLLDGSALPAGVNVIVNVSGQFSLNGGAVKLTGGLLPSQVLINNTTPQAASISGGGLLYGSFLGPSLNAQFNNNKAAVYGSVIAASIQFSSDFRVYGTGNEFVAVPEPTTLVAGAGAVLVLLGIAVHSGRSPVMRMGK